MLFRRRCRGASTSPWKEADQPEDLRRVAGQAREVIHQQHLEGRGATQRREQAAIGGAMVDPDAREGLVSTSLGEWP